MNDKHYEGRLVARRPKTYGDVDLSNLDHLEHGDLVRVAEKLTKEKGQKIDRNYVSMVKRLVIKNTDVMAELLKLGGERKKLLQKSIS